ncbi:septal ring lytic transglycosylase RlpA family protein [Hydrogenobacter sp. T-2]|uniref:septal ring lytic transglycosylase RlpA family protein n=1 Tax=Pampinifervens diazotrophicum TaxID=1632018 RepID=UPI002B257CE1|nr:septal ring lytic transglycosylase RlpA family protein [Hydrogenobacter sp. T-2]WPM32019.1 septal ring lytic transglycosylase RlpA family protein [Hydrogenobacter sp. T-2]
MKTAILTALLFFSFALAQDCKVQEGYASWYGGKFHGRKTSSGEVFNKHKFTAASRDYPLGTYLLVKNLSNGEEVVVVVTDRGPAKRSRIIDLSKSAAEKIGMLRQGVAKVQVMPLYCAVKGDELSEEVHEEIIRDLLNTL